MTSEAVNFLPARQRFAAVSSREAIQVVILSEAKDLGGGRSKHKTVNDLERSFPQILRSAQDDSLNLFAG